ncbi:DUF3316 domain-containing protein [Vibrio nigripulchritudo]|uniref:DUF3316 domain-containing protein n=1 Tax=Vibrio nigripulchritudo TaxID=28173 RepID=UPI0003B1BC6B|nr:DUF3316 domain-containing protein [Vibrio nigripulchritudo]CCN68268.1 conserved hypothetical protein [Vibrio nigripulchritudo SFn118]
MKKVTVLATALLLSSTTFASTQLNNSATSITTEGFATQEQAMNAGYTLMDEINQMTSSELVKKLPITAYTVSYNSVEVKDIEMHIEAFSKKRGEVQYRAVVDVDYQYESRDS